MMISIIKLLFVSALCVLSSHEVQGTDTGSIIMYEINYLGTGKRLSWSYCCKE